MIRPGMDFTEINRLLKEIVAKAQGCDGIKEAEEGGSQKIQDLGKALEQARGRPLFYPQFPTGNASGPYIEMEDGSVKLDMITGIGVFLFGHNHPKLIWEALKSAVKAPSMQGALMPGHETLKLATLLKNSANSLKHLPEEARGNFESLWLTTCGSMANELAVKILRQKSAPDYKIVSFKRAFAGRSSTMGELTDEPKYREGQPVFDQFFHVDFYDSKLGVEASLKQSIRQLDEIVEKEKISAFFGEPIQGEGGAFSSAPREWWLGFLTHLKSLGLGVAFDEVQTFGRTGELFNFQRLGLGKFIDVVTCAKPLELGAVLWTQDFAPKPGLIAGTFAGHTVALAQGAKILEMLIEEGHLGPNGKIQRLEKFIKADWEKRRRDWADYGAGEIRINGGMIAVEILDGQAESIRSLLQILYKNGVIAFSAGRKPVCLRFLPPMGILEEKHWLECMEVLQKSLREHAERKD